MDTPISELGFGYGTDFGLSQNGPLTKVMDEMEWIEFLLALNERLPGRDFQMSQTDYSAGRYQTIGDVVEHLVRTMSWADVRRLDVVYK